VRVKCHIAVVAAGLWAGISGLTAQPGSPDPVLQGPAPPPVCAAALDGPDYVPGLDANGQAVPRADIGSERVPVPGEILLPLPNGAGPNRPAFSPGRGGGPGGRGGRGRGANEPAYLVLDGRRVEQLVNPEPGCDPAPVN
jgi:hypothetical protein